MRAIENLGETRRMTGASGPEPCKGDPDALVISRSVVVPPAEYGRSSDEPIVGNLWFTEQGAGRVSPHPDARTFVG
jgi:hypothetical protein